MAWSALGLGTGEERAAGGDEHARRAGSRAGKRAGTPPASPQHPRKAHVQAAAPPGDGLGFLQRLSGGSGATVAPSAHHARTHQQQHDSSPLERRRRGAGAGAAQQRGGDAGGDAARRAAPVQPLAVAAVSTISVYYGLKGVLGGYQSLRRRNLRHLIRTVCPALGALGATYWLDFGSLLGAHRERDVIAHDNDADVVVLNPDWDGLLASLRAALPQFRVFFVVPSEDAGVRWIRVVHGVGVMDLYGGYDAAGGARPGMVSIPQGHGDLCDIPSPLVFPLATLKFRGAPVSAPGDVHGVLCYRYGNDYMVPKYMDKGRDIIEQGKLYARLLGLLGKAGLRV